MSEEERRLKKIATRIEKETSMIDKDKVLKMAEAVDDFAKLILNSYIDQKSEVKK